MTIEFSSPRGDKLQSVKIYIYSLYDRFLSPCGDKLQSEICQEMERILCVFVPLRG